MQFESNATFKAALLHTGVNDLKMMDGRVKYTKMMIRKSLLMQLRDTSLEKMTVTAVCKGAEINRATFYRHYNDCYDVIEEMELEMLEDLNSVFEDDNPYNAFILMLNRMKEYGDKYILICSKNGDPYFAQKIMNQCYKRMKEKMNITFPSLSEMQRELVYNYIAHGCSGILNCWLKNGMSEPPEAISSFMNILIQNTVQNLG